MKTTIYVVFTGITQKILILKKLYIIPLNTLHNDFEDFIEFVGGKSFDVLGSVIEVVSVISIVPIQGVKDFLIPSFEKTLASETGCRFQKGCNVK